MEAIQLHDRHSEEVIGTILLKGNGDFNTVTDAWDKYQDTHNTNLEEEADIYEFVADGNWMMCEVLEVNFYQP